MTQIKNADPIQHKTQAHEQPVKKRNLARGVVWAMIGLAFITLLYFVFIFVLAGASV